MLAQSLEDLQISRVAHVFGFRCFFGGVFCLIFIQSLIFLGGAQKSAQADSLKKHRMFMIFKASVKGNQTR